MRYEVRCCCQPQKVLGTLELPSDRIYADVIDWDGKIHTVEVRMFFTEKPGMEREYKHAVYSEDRPIEFWRTIPGFEEQIENE